MCKQDSSEIRGPGLAELSAVCW